MDASKILRAVDQMNLRVKRLEEAVAGFAPPAAEIQDLYHDRSKVDLEEAQVPNELISGHPLLTSLYGTESKKLTKFAVGTWPQDESSGQAVVVHGGQHNLDGSPIEFVRMRAIPALIQAGVPFSSVQVDTEEEAPGDLQLKLVDNAASHLVGFLISSFLRILLFF